MKIDAIHIDGFGVWHDRRWDGLHHGVNVFYGPNEAGKTTLMSFVRSVLFGFERRNHPRRYEPLDGGNHGGVLEVVCGGEEVRIQRSAGRHVRGRVEIAYPDGRAGDESDLGRLLAGTTRTLYHNVFAFGLEELEQFRTLQESEVAAHISGAGMGIGASRWSTVCKELDRRQSTLFLPRGQNTTINRALGELESLREELDRTAAEPQDYIEATAQLAEIEARMPGIEDRLRCLRNRMDHYRKLREAAPHRARRREIQNQLDSLRSVESFPKGGVEQLNLLAHQRHEIRTEMDGDRARSQQLGSERRALAMRYTPQELIRHERVVDGLRHHLPRLEVARERVEVTRAASEAIEGERASAVSRKETAAPPSPLVTVAFGLVVAVVAAALFLSDNVPAGGGVSFSLLLIGYWYLQRLRRVRAIDRELESIMLRLEAARTNVERAETDCNRIEQWLRALTGKSDCSERDLDHHLERVRALTDMADKIRSLDDALSADADRRERLETRARANENAIQKLLDRAGVDSESEFFHHAEVFQKRQTLLDELRRTPSGRVECTDAELAGITETDPEAYRRTEMEFEAAKREHEEARTQIGRLEERIATLARSEERSKARMRQASILARVEIASERWAVVTLCKKLLDETRQVYESERQPELLQYASGFLERMSGGGWMRIIRPLASDTLLAESPDGTRVSPDNLSRGTAEQLYLAMRLALVREYAHHAAPLPVIFDDILVNFDPERTRQALECIGDLSKTHQVLLFTCHPHLVDLVCDVVPTAAVLSLDSA